MLALSKCALEVLGVQASGFGYRNVGSIDRCNLVLTDSAHTADHTHQLNGHHTMGTGAGRECAFVSLIS